MTRSLDKLTIKGFKSIKSLDNFELTKLNVLIGANGSGKSNFIEIFRMLREMTDENFATYIMRNGGCDDFLFNGPKATESIYAEFSFSNNDYKFELVPTASEKFLIKYEAYKYKLGNWFTFNSNAYESKIKTERATPGLQTERGVGYYVYNAVSNWTAYHLHDTSTNAPMRRSEITADNKQLRPHADNLAALLLQLKTHNPNSYFEIVSTIKLVAPYFDDFILEVTHMGEKETVKLSWKQVGSNYPMQAYQFSDGTIRFIGLTAALLPPNPPSTIIIDEPELGLHPYAIEILAELIQAASEKTQVIVSTQSPALIDYFSAEDIIVVNRENGTSTFERLHITNLKSWLEEYSLGELWRKNIFKGGPAHE